MRLACLLALVACSGPISPPIGSHSGRYASSDRVQRAPPNAPPDPIGTTRPGDRSCTEDRDCRAGERCYPPDYTPTAPVAPSISPTAPAPPSPTPAPAMAPTTPSSPPGAPGSYPGPTSSP